MNSRCTHTAAQAVRALALVAVCIAPLGCIRAPDVVIVDRRTALEEQIAGRHPLLVDELGQAATRPGPQPYTSANLSGAGWRNEQGADSVLDEAYRDLESDAERVDRWLVARCVGEARSGLLAPTPRQCSSQVDGEQVNRILERLNLARRQVWLYLSRSQSDRDADAVRVAWRRAHLRGVVCGAPIQRDDGEWEVKTCTGA